MLQSHLPIIPKGATLVGRNLALSCEDGRVEFFNGSGPIYSCAEGDRWGLRLAQGLLCDLKLVSPRALAEALGVDESTVHRNRRRYCEGGIQALDGARAPRRAHKFTEDRAGKAQRLLDEGRSVRAAARELGVSEGTLRYALKKGTLTRRSEASSEGAGEAALKGPSARSTEDRNGPGGVGVKRHGERALARIGELDEARPQFVAAEGVANAGVLLALPALLSQGLLEVGSQIYGSLSKGFFGLQSVLLTFAFMALLRIKNPEQLKIHAPGELGLILGLDRAPEMKTLRRKLAELGERGAARSFLAAFTERWAHEQPQALGCLYVDGHVRAYHGRKHALPKTHVARRRLCMPATTDMWVNDVNAEPLFFVTTEANDGLLSTLDRQILPQVRACVGAQRRVTLVFDREGWSPALFEKWAGEGIDILTYRKGHYDPWPESEFSEMEATIDGKKVSYKLSERTVAVKDGFSMREVRRLCDSGHQTAVVTSVQQLPTVEVADRMFSRWRQENYFRYMRQEYALDHLCTYDVEPADPDRLVPNPAKREKKDLLKHQQNELRDLKKAYADAALQNSESQRRTMRGFKIANAELGKAIRELEEQCERTRAEVKALPSKVPIKTLRSDSDIVRLESERKILTDTIKTVAYRAESTLFNLLQPLFNRQEDEGRALLKALFQTPADLVPDKERECLVVRFHSMANPRSNETLKAMCELMNEERCRYPGTNLVMVFDTL